MPVRTRSAPLLWSRRARYLLVGGLDVSVEHAERLFAPWLIILAAGLIVRRTRPLAVLATVPVARCTRAGGRSTPGGSTTSGSPTTAR